MKILKYPSLVLLHCTLTMYWPRVDSISQWWSLCKLEMAASPGHFITLQTINAFKETISGLDMRLHRRSANLLFWKKMLKNAWKWENLYQEGVCITSGPPPSLDSACTFTVERFFFQKQNLSPSKPIRRKKSYSVAEANLKGMFNSIHFRQKHKNCKITVKWFHKQLRWPWTSSKVNVFLNYEGHPIRFRCSTFLSIPTNKRHVRGRIQNSRRRGRQSSRGANIWFCQNVQNTACNFLGRRGTRTGGAPYP